MTARAFMKAQFVKKILVYILVSDVTDMQVDVRN